MTNKLTTFYLVRHGETEWNVSGLMQGHADSPLTEKGLTQLAEVKQLLAHVHFDAAFSSDLLRAKKTAEVIALEQKIAIKTTEAIRERNYGQFEGKTFDEYNRALQRLVKQYAEKSERELEMHRLHGVEPTEMTVTRFITFLRETAVAYAGKTVLVVSHGGVMRYLLIHLGMGSHKTLPPGSIANTAFVKLDSDGTDFFVKNMYGITFKKL